MLTETHRLPVVIGRDVLDRQQTQRAGVAPLDMDSLAATVPAAKESFRMLGSQPRLFRQTKHQIHVLHGRSARTFTEIVEACH